MTQNNVVECVGPVLEASETSYALVAAIRELNPGTEIKDHGSYLRILSPGRCVLTREAAERALGRHFALPGDLEAVMPAFKGTLSITDDRAVWEFRKAS